MTIEKDFDSLLNVNLWGGKSLCFLCFQFVIARKVSTKKKISYSVYDSKLQRFKAWSLGKKKEQMLPRSINNTQAQRCGGFLFVSYPAKLKSYPHAILLSTALLVLVRLYSFVTPEVLVNLSIYIGLYNFLILGLIYSLSDTYSLSFRKSHKTN